MTDEEIEAVAVVIESMTLDDLMALHNNLGVVAQHRLEQVFG